MIQLIYISMNQNVVCSVASGFAKYINIFIRVSLAVAGRHTLHDITLYWSAETSPIIITVLDPG